MIMDGHPQVRADVTYPPSMIASGITLAVYGVQGEPIPGFYQSKIPSEIILAAELVTRENAEEYYYPDSPF
jgi:ribose transport system substrate-binding protein